MSSYLFNGAFKLIPPKLIKESASKVVIATAFAAAAAVCGFCSVWNKFFPEWVYKAKENPAKKKKKKLT